jgi:hypothetical protein
LGVRPDGTSDHAEQKQKKQSQDGRDRERSQPSQLVGKENEQGRLPRSVRVAHVIVLVPATEAEKTCQA